MPKLPKMLKLKIDPEEWTNGESFKRVWLDGKEFCRLNTKPVYNSIKRDNFEELRKILSDKLKYEVTRQQLNTAIMLEQIAAKKPNDT